MGRERATEADDPLTTFFCSNLEIFPASSVQIVPGERAVRGQRIDALFAIERNINGAPPQERARVRNEFSRPLLDAVWTWLRDRGAKLSGKSETGKAIDYVLKRWAVFSRFIDEGRLCMTNNAAERELLRSL
jgi:hypothetical protein